MEMNDVPHLVGDHLRRRGRLDARVGVAVPGQGVVDLDGDSPRQHAHEVGDRRPSLAHALPKPRWRRWLSHGSTPASRSYANRASSDRPSYIVHVQVFTPGCGFSATLPR